MFTGIIEGLGKINELSIENSNRVFFIKSDISSHLKIDESVSHNGICLTVEDIKKDMYRVTAINETLEKTNAGLWNPGDIINLERSMKLNGRLDGHIVQGHVDGTAVCTQRKDKDGSVEFTFQYDDSFATLIIEKGSICINGVSLTAFNVTKNNFTVAIIPYTFSHTNFKNLMEDDVVNIEYDILGKYVARMLNIKNQF
ncbi:MAG: riboflavin synthase [Bacteroidota bacterium]|nr:riboflavin synthase [Bacteroidota bacterium]